MSADSDARNHRSLTLSLVMLVVGMLMLSYASVPLYRLFCQVTGFGGTTERALAAPGAVGTRVFAVDFNADVDPGLNWKFLPLQRSVSLKPGEQKLALFTATNLGATPVSGTAVFNVTPHKVGPYFMKIKCFCYEEQSIAPGRTAHFPVSFFIDPEIENDPNMADVHSITLSYTFFKTKHPKITVPTQTKD